MRFPPTWPSAQIASSNAAGAVTQTAGQERQCKMAGKAKLVRKEFQMPVPNIRSEAKIRHRVTTKQATISLDDVFRAFNIPAGAKLMMVADTSIDDGEAFQLGEATRDLIDIIWEETE